LKTVCQIYFDLWIETIFRIFRPNKKVKSIIVLTALPLSAAFFGLSYKESALPVKGDVEVPSLI